MSNAERVKKHCPPSDILAQKKSAPDWSENQLLKLESQIVERPKLRFPQLPRGS